MAKDAMAMIAVFEPYSELKGTLPTLPEAVPAPTGGEERGRGARGRDSGRSGSVSFSHGSPSRFGARCRCHDADERDRATAVRYRSRREVRRRCFASATASRVNRRRSREWWALTMSPSITPPSLHLDRDR